MKGLTRFQVKNFKRSFERWRKLWFSEPNVNLSCTQTQRTKNTNDRRLSKDFCTNSECFHSDGPTGRKTTGLIWAFKQHDKDQVITNNTLLQEEHSFITYIFMKRRSVDWKVTAAAALLDFRSRHHELWTWKNVNMLNDLLHLDRVFIQQRLWSPFIYDKGS